MSEKIKNDLCQQSQTGRRLFQTFVDERIKSGKLNLWSTMKKRKLQTWKSSGKEVKVKAADKVVELKEDRSLFTRLMMVCKSRPEVDIKETVGLYEFSIVPRSLFAPDGTMKECSYAHFGEAQERGGGGLTVAVTGIENADMQVKVAIVDAMAEVQSLDKPEWIKTCKHIAEHFSNRLFSKYDDTEELRLIFARYDVPTSLQFAHGQEDKAPDTLFIIASPIQHISAKCR